jgi:hypothetical protein
MARNTPSWQFSIRPAVPEYCRCTPADFVPFFKKPGLIGDQHPARVTDPTSSLPKAGWRQGRDRNRTPPPGQDTPSVHFFLYFGAIARAKFVLTTSNT